MILRWQFVTENDFGSRAIQYATSGRASHVGFLLDDDSELGARFDKVTVKGKTYKRGVQIRPRGYSDFATRTVIAHEVPDAVGCRYREFLFNCINDSYDWRAIISFFGTRDWREPGQWICSELQAAAWEYAWMTRRLFSHANKISPVGFALVVTGSGGYVDEQGWYQ